MKFTGCIFLLVIASQVDTARILAFYPTPSISHQITFRPLTNELVRRGHEVTVATTDPQYPRGQAPMNLTEIDLHDVSYALWKEIMDLAADNKYSLNNKAFTVVKMFLNIFEQQILEPKVQEILKRHKNHFDLIMTEGAVRATLILSHLFDAPLVQVSSFGPLVNNLEIIGAPTHALLYPTAMRRRINNLTYLDKIKELLENAFIKYISITTEDYENELFKKHFGPDAPTVNDLQNNVHMWIINVHPMWAGNIPVPPSVVYTGAIHLQPPKELPQDIKSYLNSSKYGIIYFSFGTNVKTEQLKPEIVQKFLNVLSKLPYDVLWKWDQGELPGRTDNIKIMKWLPQADILRHPKVKLFITQGGLQSTDEAIAGGVPLIGFPVMVDQFNNVAQYENFKIGIGLNIDTFTEEELNDAVTTVIKDNSYRKNIEKLRAQMYDQPQTPLERGIWWIEHLLRHGGAKHLRAPAANMSYAEYYEVKLVSIVLAIVLLVIYIFFKILQYLWRSIVRLPNRLKDKIA